MLNLRPFINWLHTPIESYKDEHELLEKTQPGYHEHNGFPAHPVAVKRHQEYFSRANIETSEQQTPEIEEPKESRSELVTSPQTNISWAQDLIYRGVLTASQKIKYRKELIEKYGNDENFKQFAYGLALYSQGFFDQIRSVAAALASDTMEDLKANARGYLRESLARGEDENSLMSVSGIARIRDIFGNDTDKAEAPDELRRIKLKDAVRYSNLIQKSIRDAAPTNQPLYRGILFRKRDLPDLKSGDSFFIPEPSSFTRDAEIAKDFALGVGDKPNKRPDYKALKYQHPLIVEIVGENKSIDVDIFSTWNQQEALTNGEFEVIGWDKEQSPSRLKLKQKRIVDENWPKGAGVSYPVAKEIAKDLNEDEYEMVRRAVYSWRDRGTVNDYTNFFVDEDLRRSKEISFEKILTALGDMGFVYDKESGRLSRKL